MDRQKIAKLIESATTYETVSGPYCEKYLDEFKLVELVVQACAKASERMLEVSGIHNIKMDPLTMMDYIEIKTKE